jgi:retron-type reverse transcriptase
LLKLIESSNIVITSDLKKLKQITAKKLVAIKSYRGLRRINGFPVRGQRTHGLKFVDNARFKDIRQTTYLKNAVKGAAIICSSIGQCTKTRLNAISLPTAINTVYSYRRLPVGIYFPQSQQQANYLVSYRNSVLKMNLSKSPNTKLSFVFRRIGDIQNKLVIRKLSTGTIKKNIKDIQYRKLLNESELFKSDLKKLNSDLWKLYLKADKASTVFDFQQIASIHNIIDRYNLVVSNWLNYYKINNDFERITDNEYYVPVERLQNIFIESIAISIYSIDLTYRKPGSQTPGMDNIHFKTSKHMEDEYLLANLPKKKRNHCKYKSVENIEVQRAKVITPELKKQFKRQAQNHNKNLCLSLVSKCIIKSIRKNYTASTVKRVWIPKNNKPGLRPLGILTIREKVLQNIILLSSTPILEFSADPLSFGFRPQRSGTQCIAYLFNKIANTRTLRRKHGRIEPVSKTVYESTKEDKYTKKIRQRTSLYTKRWPINQRRFRYIYWVYRQKVRSFQPKVNLYRRIINVDIKKCFDNLSHKSVLKCYPITKKYKFFLKSWLRAKIYGKRTENCVFPASFTLNKGVPQGSIIGPACCNAVLDGLEKAIKTTLPENARMGINVSTLRYALKIHKKQSIKDLNERTSRPYVNVETIRYADDIIIIAKASYEQTIKLVGTLKNFLRHRGLELKTPDNDQFFFTFKPNTRFNYLGFTIFFPNFKKTKFRRGKFTKFRASPSNLMDQRRYDYYRATIFISILKYKISTQRIKIRQILHRSNSNKNITTIISKLNEQVRGFSNYFNLSKQCRVQLSKLDHLTHRLLMKLLRAKYKSKKKSRQFIYQHFVKQGIFQYKNQALLRYANVKLFKFRDIRNISLGKAYFDLNIYLNRGEINDKIMRFDYLNNLSLLFYKKPLKRDEFECILLNHQDYTCTKCKLPINVEVDKLEIDHSPSVYLLSKIALTDILNNIALKLYNKKFKHIDELICFESFTKELLEFDIKTYFQNHIVHKIRYSLTHKACNRADGKLISVRSSQNTKQFKKRFHNKFAENFIKETLGIRNKLNTLIRQTYKFNKRQRAKILLPKK